MWVFPVIIWGFGRFDISRVLAQSVRRLSAAAGWAVEAFVIEAMAVATGEVAVAFSFAFAA